MIKLKYLLKEYSYKASKIFDFDDTLATTDTRVKVIHKDGSESLITPGEYATYKPQPGDKFDYTEFNKMLKSPKPIDKIWKLLVAAVKNPTNKVTILTARQMAFPIRYWLKKFGLDVYVVAVADSDPAVKANWIEREIKKGAKDITFIDDSEKNVKAVEKLADKYPLISIKSVTPEYSGSLQEDGGATMNKQETLRHLKKLAKLKKYMANQGDKMMPYPAKLPNTVFNAKLLTGPNPLKIKK